MSAFPLAGAHQPARDPVALVRGILAQPRFRLQAQAVRSHTWWDVLRGWIADRWNALMDAFAHHVKLGNGTGIAIGDVLIAGLVLLVVIVSVRLLLSAAHDGASAPALTASALPEHANAAELFEAAQHAAAACAYAAAIALAFRATLASLDARGALRDDPARTVNECRRDVRSRAPRFDAAFDRIARAFTAAVYAERGAGADDWNDVERAYSAAFTVPHDAA